jgi:hypothetical protein
MARVRPVAGTAVEADAGVSSHRVTTTDLTVRLGRRAVLDGLTPSLADEIVALVGPNGRGEVHAVADPRAAGWAVLFHPAVSPAALFVAGVAAFCLAACRTRGPAGRGRPARSPALAGESSSLQRPGNANPFPALPAQK